MYENDNDLIPFNQPKRNSIIKVIGVGGGGGNAVSHMYNEGIHDVNFIVCNTDRQALENSPIPNKLQLGEEGLGAGNMPEKGRKAAEESLDKIRGMLNDGTKMVFITAGMGGGTGTGAAPVIAREAKNMGILTVGIVTIPFRFEGNPKIDQALNGVDELAKHVDALLVVNNERLLTICSGTNITVAFAKADDTLSIAAKSISEIITVHGHINLDFRDVCTVMKDGGVAIMSTGYGEGENRVSKAIDAALNSPLLNNSEIYRSKKLLLNIMYCQNNESEGLMMDEMHEVNDFMEKFEDDVITKWGLGNDSSLGDKIKVTILATGFGLDDVIDSDRYVGPSNIEDLKKKEENERRRVKYYGIKDKKSSYKVFHTYTFTKESIDDDEIIAMVDTTPTYLRTNEQFKEINKKTAALKLVKQPIIEEKKVDVTPEKTTQTTIQDNVIQFNFES